MTPQLIPSETFYDHVAASINAARHRVLAVALIVTQSEATEPLVRALVRAASRGVHVSVGADFSAYSHIGGHMKPTTAYARSVRSLTDTVNRFRSANIEFQWLGQNGPIVFAGRTHSKWIIVDDTVYAFGGINHWQYTPSSTDYMLCMNDPAMANRLAHEHERLLAADAHGRAYASHSFVTAQGTVLIDGGLPGDSIIYHRACAVAARATSIVMSSQYCPTGRLARIVRAKNARVYYNRIESVEPFTKVLLAISQRLTSIKTLYTKEPYLHAKFMIATMPDGSRVAITGSHNFVSSGGALGTREIALETYDRALIDQLDDYLNRYIA